MISQYFSHYRILETISATAVGTVYRAVDQRIDREVSLELMAGLLADDPDTFAGDGSERDASCRMQVLKRRSSSVMSEAASRAVTKTGCWCDKLLWYSKAVRVEVLLQRKAKHGLLRIEERQATA